MAEKARVRDTAEQKLPAAVTPPQSRIPVAEEVLETKKSDVVTEIRPMQKHTKRIYRQGSKVTEDGVEWHVESVCVAAGPGKPPVGSTLTAEIEYVEVKRKTAMAAPAGTVYRGRGYVWTVDEDGRTATTMMPITDVRNQVETGYCVFAGLTTDATSYMMLQRQYLDVIGKPPDPKLTAAQMDAMISIKEMELQKILLKSGGERIVK